MTRKQRWRYYCDFCKKSGGSGGHIARHEKGCTMNPQRICGFHEHEAMEEAQPPMPDLIAALEGKGADWKAGLKALRDVSDNCPACIFAAIRQSPKLKAAAEETVGQFDEAGDPDAAELFYGKTVFDLGAEVRSFWADFEPPYRGDGF